MGAETPGDFVFSLKGNRFVTNRKVLAEAGESMKKFFAQGLEELGQKLGPLFWQFANTKKFEPSDFEAFLNLLPREHSGLTPRHAVEVRHPSFVVPEFPALRAKYGAAICHADYAAYPEIGDVTADFVCSRLRKGNDDVPAAYDAQDLVRWLGIAKQWAAGLAPDGLVYADPVANAPEQPRDVFIYFIHEGKVRAPQGAMAFQALADQKD